ncbi:hypothetical protein HISP_09530 [Haloarcula hispanica N601]|jgi:hypothetical protein|uniref:YnhF family membrane protein n=7 Tax=Haloarcula TaxID=2237 RepID=Q5V2N7_HALMA|nr:unknown [Haloarcula marismortui ATCC 43049]AHB66232.1 hypothetical protein HISP_09530 [Haloarcula hispanica N601]EMA15690.1 hypothetical protein C442_19446 [Haloarcula amylolytica JCM 13557]EMA17256.1 hypothetical protein C436_00165 [Haloarcula sinaiiensis ATCC 33800]EMA18736.1 hypothetical protein C443_19609 [Haloarcula argentinensis DSM 12282]EMA19343.1 hypothetical protein C435_09019 [Haloarcula californiae ATCC 33799]EMA33003.1 hypothetical protein C444_07286 [Haloarcula japonica DSM 6
MSQKELLFLVLTGIALMMFVTAMVLVSGAS